MGSGNGGIQGEYAWSTYSKLNEAGVPGVAIGVVEIQPLQGYWETEVKHW